MCGTYLKQATRAVYSDVKFEMKGVKLTDEHFVASQNDTKSLLRFLIQMMRHVGVKHGRLQNTAETRAGLQTDPSHIQCIRATQPYVKATA